MRDALVVDIETTGLLRTDTLMCIGAQWEGSEHATAGETVGPILAAALADPAIPKVSWGLFDPRWLRQHDVEVNGPIINGMVLAWLLNENTPLNLEWCSVRYLHQTMDKRIRSSGGKPVFKCDLDEDGYQREVPLAEAPIEQVMAYNVRDVEQTTKLFRYLKSRMQETAWWDYYVAEHLRFTTVLLDMELNGLPVDLPESAKLEAELEVESAQLHEQLLDEAHLPESFNVNSGPQMANYLFAKVFELEDTIELDEWQMGALKECVNGDHEDCATLLVDLNDEPISEGFGPTGGYGKVVEQHVVDLLPQGFSIASLGRTLVHGRWTLRGRGIRGGMLTPSGDRFSTSSPALLTNFETAKDGWVTTFLRYRKMTKVLQTYLRKFPAIAHEGRVYGHFNQTGTVTGRLSSSEPNLQNIPAHGDLGPRVRNLFRAVPGTQLLVGDYSQLEPRLMAHFSQDPLMLDIYQNDRDFYITTAEGIWGETITKDDPRRGISKTYCLAMGYGAGVKKLQQILTINGYAIPLNEVVWQYGKLVELYGTFFEYREAVIRSAKRNGYVTTIAGQHRRLAAQFKSTTWKARGYGERQAVNAVIQGSAGDIVRRAMLDFHSDWPDLHMLAQVHDELVFDFPTGLPIDLQQVADTATNPGFRLSVPLVFEPHVGATWYEAKAGTTFVLPEDYASPFEDQDAEIEESDG